MIHGEPKITSREKRVFHTLASFRAWSSSTSLLSSLLALSMASRAVVKSPLVSSLMTSSRSSSYSEAERASGHKDIKIWRRLTNLIMTAAVTAVCWRLTVLVCVWLWCAHCLGIHCSGKYLCCDQQTNDRVTSNLVQRPVLFLQSLHLF